VLRYAHRFFPVGRAAAYDQTNAGQLPDERGEHLAVLRGRPDLTPEGPDILESTITPKAAPIRPATRTGGKA